MMPASLRYLLRTTLVVGLLATTATDAAAVDRTAELQKLVNDFGYQLKLVERVDGRLSQQRLQQLAVAQDRWNNSTRTDADFQVMKEWLEGAIRATMPGSTEPLPELPWFPNRLARTHARSQAETIPRPPAELAHTIPAPTQPQPSATTPSADVRPELPSAKPSLLADVWKSHPAAKPVDLGNPFEDDRPLVAEAAMPRVAMRPTGLSVASEARDVDVNVAELGARVRGYVHGLRGVEARLLAQPDMKFDELRMVVRELKQLSGQRELVGMYLDAVALEHPERSTELPSIDQAKRMVTGRLEKLRRGDIQTDAAVDTLEAMLREI